MGSPRTCGEHATGERIETERITHVAHAGKRIGYVSLICHLFIPRDHPAHAGNKINGYNRHWEHHMPGNIPFQFSKFGTGDHCAHAGNTEFLIFAAMGITAHVRGNIKKDYPTKQLFRDHPAHAGNWPVRSRV